MGHQVTREATIGRNLQFIRTLGNMSQTELAKRARGRGLQFHQPTVQRIENGERPLRLTEATVICELFECSLGDLLDTKDNHTKMIDVASGLDLAIDSLVALRDGFGNTETRTSLTVVEPQKPRHC